MKTQCKQVLLVSVLLLMLSGICHAQPIISPYDQTDLAVPMDILMGLIGKYMVMIQEYQNLNMQGGAPGTSVEFRLAANISVEGLLGTELDSVLTELSNMAVWIKTNLFSMDPYLKIDLSGSLGNIGIRVTTTESIILSRNEAIFAPLSLDAEIVGMGSSTDLIFAGEEIMIPGGISEKDSASPLNPEEFQDQLDQTVEYDGLEQTPKGIAHVVRLTSVETGSVTILWVLDETWDLYKVEIEDPENGISVIVIIDGIELVTAGIPESAFDIDTADLAMVTYDEFVMSLALKAFSVAITGNPVAADISTALPVMSQGEQVIISSNGLDSEDEESDLVAQFEYRSPDGQWMPLEGANYKGISPLGHWEAVFAPPLSELVGSYDFRVTYTDTLGNVSDPLELLGALTVIAVPPKVLSFSPEDQDEDVPISSSLTIVFDHEMDMASTESAFSLIDPSGQVVPGSFEWTDTTLIFKPAEDLMYNQDYSVKILATAMGINAAELGSDLVWNFTTGTALSPKVIAISPSDKQLDVAVSTQVSVVFSEEMDQASVESFFSITSSDGQAVPGTFQWTDNTLTFSPAQNLYYNTTYQVLIIGSAKSAAGSGLDADGDGVAEGSPEDNLSWWFSTEKSPVFAVKPFSQSAQVGDYVTVDIVAQSMSGLKSFALTIDFDPAVLNILKVERISFVMWRPRPRFIEDADIWQATVIDNDQGRIAIAVDCTRSDGVSGTNAIASLTFLAIGVGESPISPMNVSAANALGEDISPGVRDGNIQILGIDPWDINQDGVVNISDFVLIQNVRGANTDVNGDGVTDINDMVAAAGGIQSSPTMEPLVNMLSNNFPNPFNPETWIPYQLSEEANAEVRIYSVTGQLVKVLDLGYKRPGRYMTKATAAHWDGTNEVGERVTSGIYYYSIRAGNFSATKKMLVIE